MRQLMVNAFPVFGGPHNQALQLLQPLREHDWDTQVILSSEPGSAITRLREGGVPTATIGLHRPRATRDPRPNLQFAAAFRSEVRHLRGHIRLVRPDLIVLAGLLNLQPAIAARLERVPIVWQLLDTRSPRALTAVLGPMVHRYSDCLMSTGRAVAEQHLDLSGLDDRFVSFYPPVDTRRFAPNRDARMRARRELGVPDDAFVIGSVANLNPQKGHLDFLRAAARVRAAGVPARFVILGGEYSTHSDYSQQFRALAQELGLTLGEDLILRDGGSRVAELAPALDLFWLTSKPRSEGIPTAILEAMALGIPIVATDVGSVREAVEDDVTGFVVAPLRPELVADRAIWLWEHPERRQELGRRARVVAEREFSLKRCAEVHVEAFEIALKRGRVKA